MLSHKMPHLLINLMEGVISLTMFLHEMVKSWNFKRNEDECYNNKENAV
jgi:hypothetical protein